MKHSQSILFSVTLAAALLVGFLGLPAAAGGGDHSRDTDGDGRISLSEMEAGIDARHSRLDSNSDTLLLRDEFAEQRGRKCLRSGRTRAAAGQRCRDRQLRHFDRLDRDANGDLSRDEMRLYALEKFAAADADDDGFLSRAERRQAWKAKHRKRLRQRFEAADADRDGLLSTAEFTELCAHKSGKRAQRCRQHGFGRFDDDGNGEVSEAEFMATKAKHCPGKRRHSRGQR